MTGQKSKKASRAKATAKAVKRFAENVHATRAVAGLTQLQLANGAGLLQQYISRIEAGRVNPTLGTAAAIALALGVELRDLV